MISLDWKERLTKDSNDYFERKLSQGDYDFDIIYNAYPGRVENKVPRDIIILVATTLASKMLKKADQYDAFFTYIWNKKGENGKVAVAYIIAKLLRKKPEHFIAYIKNLLFKTDSAIEHALLLDKALIPFLKKSPVQYLDLLVSWLKEGNEKLDPALVKLLIKLIKGSDDLLKPIFQKLEGTWLNANPTMVHVNSLFLKSLYAINPDFYLEVYSKYKNTREPVFVEILSGGVHGYDPILEGYFTNWSNSGNARLKKAAITALKGLKKKKEGTPE